MQIGTDANFVGLFAMGNGSRRTRSDPITRTGKAVTSDRVDLIGTPKQEQRANAIITPVRFVEKIRVRIKELWTCII